LPQTTLKTRIRGLILNAKTAKSAKVTRRGRDSSHLVPYVLKMSKSIGPGHTLCVQFFCGEVHRVGTRRAFSQPEKHYQKARECQRWKRPLGAIKSTGQFLQRAVATKANAGQRPAIRQTGGLRY